MAIYAFVNSNNVLTCWGAVESNNNDRRIDVPDDFNLQPGEWQLVGDEWAPYVVPVTVTQVLTQRDSHLAYATLRIAPLQDAVDLDEATPAEIALLKKWKQYRVALSRIDQQPGYHLNVNWPVSPEDAA